MIIMEVPALLSSQMSLVTGKKNGKKKNIHLVCKRDPDPSVGYIRETFTINLKMCKAMKLSS